MKNIEHEVKIKAPIEKVFKALTSLQELKCWHTADITGSTKQQEVMTFAGKDKPSFRWKTIGLEPNKKVVWECIEGPGDSVGTQAIYKLSETDNKHTILEFSHTKWPLEAENFRKCNTLWGNLLYHLKKYTETGSADPVIK